MTKKTFKFLLCILACTAPFLSEAVKPLVPIKDVHKREKKLIQVWTSLAPHISIVRAIGGSLVNVASVVPQSSDPHNFEMPPSQIEKLSSSDVWFGGGDGFERQASKAIGARVLFRDLNKGKPHGLLDPDSLKDQARQVADILKNLDPESALYFERNLGEFIDNVDLTDRKVKDILARAKTKTLLVMHPAFTTFCEYYGIEQLNVSTCDQCTSIRHIEHVEKRAHALKLKTLYIQPQEQSLAAIGAAEKLKLKMEILDPYEEDVLSNFIKIAQAAAL